jgi:hypothetical protein
MDYLSKKSLSRRSSQRSNRPTSLRSSITKKKSPPKQLNLAQVEDPLLALVAAANNLMPMTPPADEPTFHNLDASTKMPDTPMADQFFEDDDSESEQSETEFDIETTHLVTHAKVYAIAEKYVPLFVIVYFSTFCLNARPGLWGSFSSACSAWHGGFKRRQTPRCASQALRFANHTSRCPLRSTFAHTALSSVFLMYDCTSANRLSWSPCLHGCIFETVRVSVQLSLQSRTYLASRTVGLANGLWQVRHCRLESACAQQICRRSRAAPQQCRIPRGLPRGVRVDLPH